MSTKDGEMSGGVFAWEFRFTENGNVRTESQLGVRGD